MRSVRHAGLCAIASVLYAASHILLQLVQFFFSRLTPFARAQLDARRAGGPSLLLSKPLTPTLPLPPLPWLTTPTLTPKPHPHSTLPIPLPFTLPLPLPLPIHPSVSRALPSAKKASPRELPSAGVLPRGSPPTIGIHIRGGDSCYAMRYCPSNLTQAYFMQESAPAALFLAALLDDVSLLHHDLPVSSHEISVSIPIPRRINSVSVPFSCARPALCRVSTCAQAANMRERYGVNRIFLATDNKEAARLCEARVLGFECTHISIDRSKFESRRCVHYSVLLERCCHLHWTCSSIIVPWTCRALFAHWIAYWASSVLCTHWSGLACLIVSLPTP